MTRSKLLIIISTVILPARQILFKKSTNFYIYFFSLYAISFIDFSVAYLLLSLNYLWWILFSRFRLNEKLVYTGLLE